MPATKVFYYIDERGRSPVQDWLAELRKRDVRGEDRCHARIRELARQGHELRRPLSDTLEDGIHELRAKSGRVQYRILYFFYKDRFVVLAAAFSKEGKVPRKEIERAKARRAAYEAAKDRDSRLAAYE